MNRIAGAAAAGFIGLASLVAGGVLVSHSDSPTTSHVETQTGQASNSVEVGAGSTLTQPSFASLDFARALSSRMSAAARLDAAALALRRPSTWTVLDIVPIDVGKPGVYIVLRQPNRDANVIVSIVQGDTDGAKTARLGQVLSSQPVHDPQWSALTAGDGVVSVTVNGRNVSPAELQSIARFVTRVKS